MASDLYESNNRIDLEVGPDYERRKRKAGIFIIENTPKEEWDTFLRMLGIKDYEPEIIRHRGVAYNRLTGEKILVE